MYARDGFHHSQWNNEGPDTDDSALPTPAATFAAATPTEAVLTTSDVQTTSLRASPTLLTFDRTSSASQASVTNVADGSANLSADNGYTSRAMSDGAIAAAVIVPLLILGVLAAIFMLWRRKSKPAIPDMVEQSREHYAPVPPPIAGYYTGLDPDHISTSDEPPPPYGNKAAVPLIAEPDQSETESSISWRTADAGLLAPEAERQSISSTGYSDNVSIHSARAAHMSGGAIISDLTAPRDPFDDPESPVSSIAGDEILQGRISRAVSPVNSLR